MEEKYVADAVRSGWVSSTGPYIDRFEAEFAARCGTTHAVAVNNGTSALHLVLAAAGIGPGDEVIVPAFTYIATANAVTYCGATPVFVDVEPDTWCIGPDAVTAAITPRTKAVIAVDIYGHPADYTALRPVCSSHGLLLIADAAESLGGRLDGAPVGALADATTFSFFGNKILTSGEGGCVTTADDELAAKMRLFKNQGMDPNRRYFFPVIGFNYRMTNVAAAILCGQLERSEQLISRRKDIVSTYERWASGKAELEVPRTVHPAERAPWMASLLVSGTASYTRDQLTARLADLGVDTRPFFPPLPGLPAYGPSTDSWPVSEQLSRRGFNLPTYPDLTDPELEEILRRLDCAFRDIQA
ncbi:DegT/DnrJ/EryC1/StrS family aminotransferase [Actinoplanes sp. NPDC051859]|uniref:DegT/DnrJ/EryC1/StrS family aminotransferase n=1 Tax=Actinoplanes sp. NPDC051859 TaxID=3363909 RepID=UPI00379432F7